MLCLHGGWRCDRICTIVLNSASNCDGGHNSRRDERINKENAMKKQSRKVKLRVEAPQWNDFIEV